MLHRIDESNIILDVTFTTAPSSVKILSRGRQPKKMSPNQKKLTNAVWHKKLLFDLFPDMSKRQWQQPIQFLLQLLSLWFYWRKSESEHKFWQSKKPKKSLEFALFFFFFFSQEFWNFFTYQHVTYYSNITTTVYVQRWCHFFISNTLTSWTFHDVILLSFENGIQSRTRRYTIWNLLWNRR